MIPRALIRSATLLRILPTIMIGLVLGACAAPAASNTPVPATPRPTASATPVALAALPTDFPIAWVEEGEPAPLALEPSSRGLRGHREGRIRAEDGTIATYTTSFVENRVPVAEITCGSVVYQEVYTVEDPVSTTTVQIPGWGEAQLEASQRVVVYSSAFNGSSVALCDVEVGGTYELNITDGPQPAMWSGTWLRDETGRLILQ